MYKRIMAAVDENFATGPVLETAIAMAAQSRARLAVCYALDHTVFARREGQVLLANSVEQIESDMHGPAQEVVDRAAEAARASGLEVDTRIVESEKETVADMLARAALEWQADLLVVGMHRLGVERFFVASVAEALAKKATTSLLLVRSA